MNYAAYLKSVNERLGSEGFAALEVPADLSGRIALALAREEPWGRLIVALASELNMKDAEAREALARAAGAWIRLKLIPAGRSCQMILLFPFDRRVTDDESAAIAALRAGDAERRWGIIPWSADLDVGLLDQHTGFPPVDPAVARALTDVPRGAVESLVERATGPRVGRPRAVMALDDVPVTRLILAGTIAYYLWSVLMGGGIGQLISGPSTPDLVTWGANYTLFTLGLGQQWRLLTHLFLHGGLMHLAFNMWALWQVGRYIEMIYGSGRMLFIYIAAGVAGGAASVALRPSLVVSVGASGAILGLMGALIYFASTVRNRRVDWQGLWGPVVINLLFGFFYGVVDNYAHIGGLLGGMAAAFVAGVPGQRHPWRRAGMGVLALLIALLLAGLIPLRHISSLLG